MDALDFYGLSLDPFDKNSMVGRQSVESTDHRKALDAMGNAVSRNGLCLIVAKSGLGKSHTVDRFLKSLDTSSCTPAYVAPGLSNTQELYRMLCSAFNLDSSGNKQRLLNTLKDFLYNCYMRKKPAVIIVDEAQDLKPETLSELRILMNFERDTLNVFALILIGEPSLAAAIQNKEKLDPLRQRITSRYKFNGLTNEEVRSYVKHKLEFAGGSDILVDEPALSLLSESSQGISRTIDNIMSDALKWGYQLRHHTIDPEVMRHAIDSQSLI